MTNLKITIKHLSFVSPQKEAATIKFNSGFNLIYGSSNTGKSSILDAIDFMFGRSRKLKEIPEHVGYAEIFLGLEFSDGSKVTLSRSIDGGDYDLFEGLHFSTPESIEAAPLKAKISTKKIDSVSDYLLKKTGFHGKLMKRNAKNQTEKLSIRTLLPLFFATETNIQKELSPFRTPQYTKETVELSRLKLLLTGIDDSALKSTAIDEREVISRTARMGMLEELIQDVSEKIDSVISDGASKDELEEQVEKLETTLSRSNEILAQAEESFLSLLEEKNTHQANFQTDLNRLNEVKEMIQRFGILLQHYASDLNRLEGVIEAGSLISVLESENCPLCGASKEDHDFDHICDADTSDIVVAAKAEREKIDRLERDLKSAIDQLHQEAQNLGLSLKSKRESLEESAGKINKLTPDLTQYRAQFSELHQKKSFVRRSIELFDAREELEEKLADVSEAPEKSEKTSDNRVPTSALFELAKRVRKLLSEWSMPNADQIHFDPETTDIILNGKHRASNGKGHRSITHAAMTLGLATYLEEKSLPTLGFVVLDSPLLAYEEPDEDDEISETNLNELFLDSLVANSQMQTIVFENKKSVPSNVEKYENVTHFTKNSSFGRYGFFPTE